MDLVRHHTSLYTCNSCCKISPDPLNLTCDKVTCFQSELEKGSVGTDIVWKQLKTNTQLRTASQFTAVSGDNLGLFSGLVNVQNRLLKQIYISSLFRWASFRKLILQWKLGYFLPLFFTASVVTPYVSVSSAVKEEIVHPSVLLGLRGDGVFWLDVVALFLLVIILVLFAQYEPEQKLQSIGKSIESLTDEIFPSNEISLRKFYKDCIELSYPNVRVFLAIFLPIVLSLTIAKLLT